MIQMPLKRGQKCYWKHGDSYSTAYFLSLNQMRVAPHAVKIRHNGDEAIVKDCEVFTEVGKFEKQYEMELHYIRHHEQKRGCKKRMAEEMEMKYSTVLLIYRKAKLLGVDLCPKNTSDTAANEK